MTRYLASIATLALLAQSARAATQCTTKEYGDTLAVQQGSDYNNYVLAEPGSTDDAPWVLSNGYSGFLTMFYCTSDHMNITQSQDGSLSYVKLVSNVDANTNSIDDSYKCLTAQFTDTDTATFNLSACSFEDDESQEGQFFTHLHSGSGATFKDILKLIGPPIRAHNPDSEGPGYNYYGEGSDKVLTARYQDDYKSSLALEEIG